LHCSLGELLGLLTKIGSRIIRAVARYIRDQVPLVRHVREKDAPRRDGIVGVRVPTIKGPGVGRLAALTRLLLEGCSGRRRDEDSPAGRACLTLGVVASRLTEGDPCPRSLVRSECLPLLLSNDRALVSHIHRLRGTRSG
jgi:hypothetical protein